MNQTTNYQLSQWEATDRILMSDFNSDNAKIDGALKVQADAIAELETSVAAKADASTLPYVKLAETVAETAHSQLTMSLNGITLTDYASVHLYLMGPSQWEVGLRLNGQTSGYYIGGDDTDSLCFFRTSGGNVVGDVDFFCPQTGSAILCCFNTLSSFDIARYIGRASLQWQELQSIQLYSRVSGTQLSAGLGMVLYGLKW